MWKIYSALKSDFKKIYDYDPYKKLIARRICF